MGSKEFEVYVWTQNPWNAPGHDDVWSWWLVYSGDSMKDALSKMFELKASGECVLKLEWRNG